MLWCHEASIEIADLSGVYVRYLSHRSCSYMKEQGHLPGGRFQWMIDELEALSDSGSIASAGQNALRNMQYYFSIIKEYYLSFNLYILRITF